MKKLILICLLCLACTASNTGNNNPSSSLEAIIVSKHFQLVSQWANPQYTAAMSQLSAMGLSTSGSVGGRMDISSITNYFTFKNDSVFASLPYFGERQMGAGSGNIDQGIIINGIPRNLKIEQKGSFYNLRFNINDSKSKSENYQVRIKLTSNLSSVINITSSHRYNISYDGNIAALNNSEN